MLQHSIHRHTLHFKRPSGTSRGVLRTKDSWFIKIWDTSCPGIMGIGECSIIEGLSPDPLDRIENVLDKLEWEKGGLNKRSRLAILDFPAIQFAVETALLDLHHGGQHILYPSPFTQGSSSIDINGLIWMGDRQFMQDQIKAKIDQGYRCVKMKIGAIDFQTELALLTEIRGEFPKDDIQLRVDANGAFEPKDALEKLQRLSELDLHSIEQPIRQGQIEEMAKLCSATPLPIALDEELIDVNGRSKRSDMIQTIRPQYIILKPSLVGGTTHAQEWIDIASAHQVGWWITSALESNIGLNAIAQWTATLDSDMFQGLGTGQLYSNNVDSPLKLDGDRMYYDPMLTWGSIQ